MSFGEELRRERELRQISLREVAQATKINIRYLEAMERNDFAYLPGGLFNRGFVRAYCKHIGVDPEAMVNAYLLEERTQTGGCWTAVGDGGLLLGAAARPGVEPRTVEPSTPARGSRRRRWLLALMVVAAVITAGAFLVWWVLDESSSTAPPRARPAPEVGAAGSSMGDRA
jgi:cytoskeletal protein RodZ